MTKYQILSNNGYHYDYFIRLGDISIYTQDHIYLFNITYFMQISIKMHIEIVRL